MGCVSGTHPAEKEGVGEGPQVQKKEDPESIQRWRSPFPALWILQRLFDRGGLCKVYQLSG